MKRTFHALMLAMIVLSVLAPHAAFGAGCALPQHCVLMATGCGSEAVVGAGVAAGCAAAENCCSGVNAAGGTITFDNPLAFSTVQGATGAFLTALQGIIVSLALVFLVLGGVLYVISAGDEKKITSAKGAITAAMIGLAIGIAAPSFLKQIGDILGWGGAAAPAAVAAAPSLGAILKKVLDFLLSMVGVLAIIMMVIGGLMYFAAAGDEKRAETAKTIVKYAMIGVAVALASLVAVTQIATFF
jgi:hypothetical protein